MNKMEGGFFRILKLKGNKMGQWKIENLLIEETVIIYKYLIKMGASKEDAEDIIQDTICKGIENIDALEEGKVSAWLFKVAINGYYNLYNKKKRTNINLDEGILSELYSDKSVEGDILSTEFKEKVQKVLDSLKESYRSLLILKYFLELSYKEIGDLLDLNESTVKTYLYRARNKFREVWELSKYE